MSVCIYRPDPFRGTDNMLADLVRDVIENVIFEKEGNGSGSCREESSDNSSVENESDSEFQKYLSDDSCAESLFSSDSKQSSSDDFNEYFQNMTKPEISLSKRNVNNRSVSHSPHDSRQHSRYFSFPEFSGTRNAENKSTTQQRYIYTAQAKQTARQRSECTGSSSQSGQNSGNRNEKPQQSSDKTDSTTRSQSRSSSRQGREESDSDSHDESRKRRKTNENVSDKALLAKICLLIIAAMIIKSIFSREQVNGITLPDDIPEQAPVYLYAENESSPFRLFKPNGRVTNLPINSRLLLVGSGRDSNYIKKVNLRNLLLIYHGNNVFRTIENVEYNLNQLTTSSPATATLRRIPYGHGYIIEIGFEYGTNQFAVLYTIYCNGDGTRTYYTHNTINGATIKHDVKKKRRPAFSADGMAHNTVAVNNIYTQQHQKARFEFLFGPAQPYIDSRQFLARGHLTPDADMIFPYEKMATYYYGNVAPQFQPINAGNWLRVENLARTLAEQLNRDLQVYTGHMGILRLPHPLSPTNEVEIYLDENIRIYAPEFFFRVLLDEQSDSAIVFVTSNNPFATQVNEFATNIANEAGFSDPNFRDYTRGYTFCLSLPDFLNHFPYLPKNVNATNILRGNFK